MRQPQTRNPAFCPHVELSVEIRARGDLLKSESDALLTKRESLRHFLRCVLHLILLPLCCHRGSRLSRKEITHLAVGSSMTSPRRRTGQRPVAKARLEGASRAENGNPYSRDDARGRAAACGHVFVSYSHGSACCRRRDLRLWDRRRYHAHCLSSSNHRNPALTLRDHNVQGIIGPIT